VRKAQREAFGVTAANATRSKEQFKFKITVQKKTPHPTSFPLGFPHSAWQAHTNISELP
jgi:hypothetical protein